MWGKAVAGPMCKLYKVEFQNLLFNNLSFLLPQLEDFARRFDDYR